MKNAKTYTLFFQFGYVQWEITMDMDSWVRSSGIRVQEQKTPSKEGGLS
jgi:hypothetical protein